MQHGKLNAREVLLDPFVSAICGNVLLLTCLVLITVLMVTYIDVRKVIPAGLNASPTLGEKLTEANHTPWYPNRRGLSWIANSAPGRSAASGLGNPTAQHRNENY